MEVAKDAPKRPAIQYYGSKWLLAPWIISHFPQHDTYVDLCGGSASVLLQKTLSPLEVYNDIEKNVVTFFRVMRDNFDELIRKIELTPWARDEYVSCKEPSVDPIENSRRFFVTSHMSMSSMAFEKSTGWRHLSSRGERYKTFTNSYSDTKQGLYDVAKRLLSVQIESMDVLDAISKYDSNHALLYFDPPYVKSTRVAKSQYIADADDRLHVDSADLLRQCAGYVVISGYACQLYAELYEAYGWYRVDKESQVNGGGKRIESLWLSPRTWKALRDNHDDLPLFA